MQEGYVGFWCTSSAGVLPQAQLMHALALRWDGDVVGNAIPSLQTHQSNGFTSFGPPTAV
jgi:hypothetical protein